MSCSPWVDNNIKQWDKTDVVVWFQSNCEKYDPSAIYFTLIKIIAMFLLTEIKPKSFTALNNKVYNTIQFSIWTSVYSKESDAHLSNDRSPILPLCLNK